LYSIDTSALLDGWVRNYPPDVFGSVWSGLKNLGNGGRLVASDEVIEELAKKDDGVWKWAKSELTLYTMDAEIQRVVAEILAVHQRLVDERRNRSKCDPFVIALAKMKGFTVVTGEKASGNLQKPRIPDVCGALNIKCINLLALFREQGWQI
jgi:hypothetical protein